MLYPSYPGIRTDIELSGGFMIQFDERAYFSNGLVQLNHHFSDVSNWPPGIQTNPSIEPPSNCQVKMLGPCGTCAGCHGGENSKKTTSDLGVEAKI